MAFNVLNELTEFLTQSIIHVNQSRRIAEMLWIYLDQPFEKATDLQIAGLGTYQKPDEFSLIPSSPIPLHYVGQGGVRSPPHLAPQFIELMFGKQQGNASDCLKLS